jgi:hypothetical protein
VLDFSGVTFVNSTGIRSLLAFLASFRAKRTVAFELCPSAVVSMLNMIPAVGRGITVRSVYGTFYCSSCDQSDTELFVAGASIPEEGDTLDDRKCTRCGEPALFEDDPNHYFAFARAKS